LALRIDRRFIQPLQDTSPQQKVDPSVRQGDGTFQSILERHLDKAEGGIKISGHASRRLMERSITLDASDIKALSDAIDKAWEKGARESLVLYKDIAFIASVRNRTLITAVDPRESKDNVFTNIDSAIIVEKPAGPNTGAGNAAE